MTKIQKKQYVLPNKSDVGLSNVDNTSDTAKPVSTLQAASIATKEPSIAASTVANYWRGDKTWQVLNPTAVGLPNVDNTSDATKKLDIMQTLNPIGTIYTNKTNATNPATLFGFGTWTALAGRVIVGKAASGTFATAGAVMGAETHTLTIAEMPSHNHITGDQFNVNISSATSPRLVGQSTGASVSSNTGGGGSHNNIQPSLVAYMWERTA